MSDNKQQDDAETQETEQGYEIPVPEREDVMDVFRRAARPVEAPADEPDES